MNDSLRERTAGPVRRAAAPPAKTFLYKYFQSLFRVFTSCYFDLQVTGTRYVPRSGGALIVSNHQSYLDPVLIGVQLYRPLSFMAKSELFENPVFGWGIRNLGAFPVRQTGSAAGAVKEAIDRLQAGHILNIFPEGSRTHTGEILTIEKGVAIVLRRARVPVIPAVIDGSFYAWPKNRKIFRSYPIRVAYGPPMDLAELRPEEIVRRVDTTLRTMFETLREKRRRAGM